MMFTGIIEEQSKIMSLKQSAGKTIVNLARPLSFDDLIYGSSVACNGICLTVLQFDSSSFSVEIMNETVHKTTASLWNSGDQINLERALKIGARLDGHWVQGHIDTTSKFIKKDLRSGTTYLWFELNAEYRKLIVAQGSIAINGVSLTVAELKADSFAVALISHTLSNTNLDGLDSRSMVNIEFDILGKYILNLQLPDKSKISEKWLYEQGF